MTNRWGWIGAAALAILTASCGGDGGGTVVPPTLDEQLAELIDDNGLEGSPELREPLLTAAQRDIREKRRELGRNLFFDHALSGVEQTACSTCHHPARQFTDARNIARGVYCDLVPDVSITCDDAPPEGEDGNVVGPDRSSPLNSRNSPTLINSALYPRQMWNGRFAFIECVNDDVNDCDASKGFRFPAPESDLLYVRSLPAAQALIPVTELVEMTGDFPHFDGIPEEPAHVNEEIRGSIARVLDDNDTYRSLFEEAYPENRPDLALSEHDPWIPFAGYIPYLAVADALGHFMETLVMTDAPWDRYVRGDTDAISVAAKRGALAFYEGDRCSSCHAGDMFSDFDNHNIGVPQVGPGTGRKALGDPAYEGLTNWDFGLEEITFARGDRFKFRTPPLRGVAVTSPYMHNGAYTTLADAIRHHFDPAMSYDEYDLTQIEPDMQAFGLNPAEPVFDDRNPVVLGTEAGQQRISLTSAELADVIEFLKALTDPRMMDSEDLAPETVPSGLPVDVVGPRQFPLYE